jgi:hypothetical protein
MSVTSVKKKNMNQLELMFQQNMVYMVHGFICWNSQEYPLSPDIYPKPIMYPCLAEFVKSDTDYPLWSPTSMGVNTSFGKGLLTVNYDYLKNLGYFVWTGTGQVYEGGLEQLSGVSMEHMKCCDDIMPCVIEGKPGSLRQLVNF